MRTLPPSIAAAIDSTSLPSATHISVTTVHDTEVRLTWKSGDGKALHEQDVVAGLGDVDLVGAFSTPAGLVVWAEKALQRTQTYLSRASDLVCDLHLLGALDTFASRLALSAPQSLVEGGLAIYADGEIFCNYDYIAIDGDSNLKLDGSFTAIELRWLADYIAARTARAESVEPA